MKVYLDSTSNRFFMCLDHKCSGYLITIKNCIQHSKSFEHSKKVVFIYTEIDVYKKSTKFYIMLKILVYGFFSYSPNKSMPGIMTRMSVEKCTFLENFRGIYRTIVDSHTNVCSTLFIQ